jgi:Mg-chelatase subunit ChlI
MNIVEREGISFAHPARYILVGTMNPEEGDLRPQLLDRFALSVDIRGLNALADRVAIIERNLAFEADPEGFRAHWLPQEQELSRKIEAARQLIDRVTYNKRDLLSIAALTSSLQVDGHRADLVILKAARAQAAFESRPAITDLDIALAAELALPHRLRRGPFHQSEVSLDDLQARIDQAQAQVGAAYESEPSTEEQPADKKKVSRVA